jgi:hypothetical protein
MVDNYISLRLSQMKGIALSLIWLILALMLISYTLYKVGLLFEYCKFYYSRISNRKSYPIFN